MLGLLFIYFIGKYFYQLAGLYGKNKWGFAVLGVISYYVGSFIAGIVATFCIDLFNPSLIEDIGDLAFSLIGILFGLATCVAFYFMLKNIWEKRSVADDSLIDEIDVFEGS